MTNIAVMPFKDFPHTPAKPVLRKGLLDKVESIPTGTVLIYSMAGYGKTTLLSQLAVRNQPAAVCLLSHSDNDLSFFLEHLSAAVQQSVAQPENIGVHHPFTVLLQICRAALANRMILIFDNCQVITDKEVCKALQFLMSEADKGFKVVLSSRMLPDFAVRFILEGRCRVFRRADLALSEKEIGELVKMHLNGENRQFAKDLYDFTRGWAAGVMFCLRRGENMTGKFPAWDDMVERGLIRKYITFEVFPGLPEHVARFAQRASIMDSLSADECDPILETDASRECLNFLAENEIFLDECPGEPKTFRWIDIFRKALLDHLATAEKTVLAEKTVEFYLRRKMYLKAIDFALKTGKPNLIRRVLSLCGESLLEQEQFELLGSCVQMLEKGGEKLDAALHGLLAQYYYVAGDYAKMDYNFNMADSMFGKENIYSTQRSLYRGLLRYETDPPKYQKIINNVLFYLDEYNSKLPFLLPRERQLLSKIKSLNSAEGRKHDRKPLKIILFAVFI